MSVDVRRWLETSGFGQYTDLFDAHRIDAEALVALTDQHLGQMGIPLGPRLNLLAALARASAASPPRSGTGERRRLTVMFVDLVGSTELSDRLDPEDLRQVIRVRVPSGEALVARIGIATGLVVVGDLIGTGDAREHAVGQTPNLAARLQALAKPHEILVSDRTRELIGSSFELRELGEQQLKGIAAPVDAFAVTGERAVESRFEAQRTSLPAAMVGRNGDLALLTDRWCAASSGQGQVVLLRGEAGIGKSRLLRAMQDSLAAEPPVVLYHQCSPYHADSALYPPIQQLTRAARIYPGDSVDTRLDRLETLFAGAVAPEIALIGALLGIDGTQRYGTLDLTPQQQRLRTFDALMNQLVRVAGVGPVLWILEDAQWIDPTTLELVQRCIDQVGQVRVLAVVTARPDFRHDFGTHNNLTRMELNRLGHAEITAMVDGVTGGELCAKPSTRSFSTASRH